MHSLNKIPKSSYLRFNTQAKTVNTKQQTINEFFYPLWPISFNAEGHVYQTGKYAHVLEGVYAPMC